MDRALVLPSLYIWEFVEGQINRIIEYADMASVMVQVGVMPSSELPPLVPSFTLPPAETNSLTPAEVITETLNRLNARDLAGFAKLHHAEEEVVVTPLGIPMGREEFISLVEMLLLGFPDLCGEVVRTIELGEGWVLQERIYEGRHTGPYMGIPPTGRSIQLREAILCQVGSDGLIRVLHDYYDSLSILALLNPEPVGIFENHMDIGDIAPGETTFNSETGEYQIKGSDGTAENSEDADARLADFFHFSYSEVSGDFRVKAKIRAENVDTEEIWGMAGLIVKDALTTEAPFYLASVRTDSEVSLVYRSLPDNPWNFSSLNIDAQHGVVEIIREADFLSINFIDDSTGEPIEFDYRPVNFEDPVYVGLLVRSWDPGKYTMGYFTEVEASWVAPSAVNGWALYE